MATVLVIDDDEQMRRIAARVLVGAGHTVHEACDGIEGLGVLQRHAIAVVVTDILMPEQEGIDTIREIRRIAPEMRIIAMSGGGAAQDMMFLDIARAFGADGVLAKPFRAAELVAAVSRLLEPPADETPR